MPHVDDDDLERLRLGMLDGPDLERVEGHLLICRRCVQRACEVAATVDAIRTAAAQERARNP